jgi:hypothetical protein
MFQSSGFPVLQMDVVEYLQSKNIFFQYRFITRFYPKFKSALALLEKSICIISNSSIVILILFLSNFFAASKFLLKWVIWFVFFFSISKPMILPTILKVVNLFLSEVP